ncbi:MAG: GntR family transcriptional regulator [Planctomyces sp.]
MICQIDVNNGIPIYEQICRQVKFAVANGSLLVGEHVPSVRELAIQAAVNVNTVARAYRDLQSAGILVSIRGTGLAVSPDAPHVCRSERLQMIDDRLRSVLSEAHHNGIALAEVQQLIQSEWDRLNQREVPDPGS